MAKQRSGVPEVYIREGREHVRMFRQNMRPNPIVLEIGCNDGMHSRLFLDEVPGISLHCFEPDPRPVNRFKAAINDDARARFYPVAITAKTGPVPWFASGGTTKNSWLDDWDLSGSTRRPTGHLQMSPWVTFQEKGTVEGVALDDWAQLYLNEADAVDLVFADVQGAEGDMILGGRDTFTSRVRYLYTEFYPTPMYEGQPNLQQILDMLPGYELVSVHGDNAYLRNTKLK